MTTRAYHGTTLARLTEMLGDGGLGPTPLPARADTARLQQAWPDLDEEQREYAALTAAAQDSVLALDEDDAPRRVVVVFEAETVQSTDPDDPTRAEVVEVVPWRLVAAVHLDDAAAEPDVAAAHEACSEGRDDAAALLERCLEHELGWYAAQEVPRLLADQGLLDDEQG